MERVERKPRFELAGAPSLVAAFVWLVPSGAWGPGLRPPWGRSSAPGGCHVAASFPGCAPTGLPQGCLLPHPHLWVNPRDACGCVEGPGPLSPLCDGTWLGPSFPETLCRISEVRAEATGPPVSSRHPPAAGWPGVLTWLPLGGAAGARPPALISAAKARKEGPCWPQKAFGFS